MADSAKKILLVIDGNALIHRAWHAIPPLTNKDGVIISGAYGFTMIMLGAIRQLNPAYVAVTFDLKGPTFRHEEFAAYKATREKKPDELYAQIPLTRRVLDAMGVPVYTAQGFEADDVIGSIARQANAADKDLETVIVTGDLDTLQLIDDRTKVFTLRKGMADTVLYDAAAVEARFGLTPAQMIDYKALRGDQSDNIPGVKGIGEKTATELLQKFSTLDGIFESLEAGDERSASVKPAARQKLLAGKGDANLARRLCTIRRDLDVNFKLPDCAWQPPTREAMTPIFEELQFHRLLAQLPSNAPAVPTSGPAAAVPAVAGGAYTTVEDEAGLKKMLSALKDAPRLAWRTLTRSESPVSADVIALGLTDGTRSYVVRGAVVSAGRERLRPLFDDPKTVKVTHDLKLEMNILSTLGLPVMGRGFDLMVAAYLLYAGERRPALDALLAYRRNVPLPLKDQDDSALVGRLMTAELPHFLPLADELAADLEKENLTRLFEEVEMPLVSILSRMERAGVAADRDRFRELGVEVGARAESARSRIVQLAGVEFNVNSPRQLKEILFDKLALSAQGVKKTAKGGELSTAAAELLKLRGSHPIVDAILEYRELVKLKSTYLDVLPEIVNPETGRIHARFNQTVTATGRLSSSDPNLQNIPTADSEYGQKLRQGFVAADGCVLLAADYSQIELRLAAHIAQERHMMAAFRDGEDIHRRTAAEMWGEAEADAKRRLAKVINFGILYGMGPQRLSESAGISFIEARDYIDRYFALHPGISKYMADMVDKLKQDGYVETLYGRRRRFTNYALMNRREQAEAERQAINMPIQGTSADIIKMAMVRLDDLIRERYGDGPDAPVRLIMQVHDELIFEVSLNMAEEFAALVKPVMEDVPEISVPIIVDMAIGERWGEMEDVA